MATVDANRRPRIGEQLVYCPKCGSRCRARNSLLHVTYYSCQNGCKLDKAIKVRRPQ